MQGVNDAYDQGDIKDADRGVRGALLELVSSSVPLVFLGLASGVTVPSYLASLGFFQEKFSSDLLFGAQAAVVVLAHFCALVLQEWFDADVLPAVVPGRGCLVRLPACSVLGCLALGLTPTCSSKVAVLLNGALVSMVGTWLHTASSQVGAVEGGGLLVSAGFALGSLVAALLVWATRFGPGASLTTAYLYYWLAGALCLAGAPLWLLCRRGGAEEEADDAEWPADAEPAEALPLHGGDTGRLAPAYQALSRAGGAPSGGADEPLGASSGSCLPTPVTENAVGIFVSLAFGFALVPLFPLCGPPLAGAVYQMTCLGDCVGRLFAVRHASHCAVRGASADEGGLVVGSTVCGSTVRCAALWLVALRFVAALVVMAWLLARGRAGPDPSLALALVAGVYGAGGYGQFVLDLDAQLAASEHRRGSVARCHTLVMFLGMTLGLAAGFALASGRARF